MMAAPLALLLLLVAQQLLGAQPYKDEDVILEDKYGEKNSKNYRSDAIQKPSSLQSVQLLHTNTLTY